MDGAAAGNAVLVAGASLISCIALSWMDLPMPAGLHSDCSRLATRAVIHMSGLSPLLRSGRFRSIQRHFGNYQASRPRPQFAVEVMSLSRSWTGSSSLRQMVDKGKVDTELARRFCRLSVQAGSFSDMPTSVPRSVEASSLPDGV